MARLKRWRLLGLALVCLMLLPVSATAGVLTSSGYTYLLGGREIDLPVDLLTVQGSPLVPPELLSALGLSPQVDGDRIQLTRGPVTVDLTLGADTAMVDGRPKLLKTGPITVSDRLFIPAEVLPDLGITLTVDGKFVLMADYIAEERPAPEDSYLRTSHTAEAQVRDDGQLMNVRVTTLTEEMLGDPALGIPWGTRLQLARLLQSRTLLLITVRNPAIKSVSLEPGKLMLVGDDGRQYDFAGQELPVDGRVSAAVAPGAIRSSVLAYPLVEGERVTIYYDDGSGTAMGRLPVR
ncbi:MAG TPA: stalk domain-containing protein [Symbiobacteriaceae bacterium]|nr:stalk domain-containing protein [Symbiobacteriaceae bacterium]